MFYFKHPLQLVASMEVAGVVAPLLRNDTLEIVVLTNHIRYRMLSNVLSPDPHSDNHNLICWFLNCQ